MASFETLRCYLVGTGSLLVRCAEIVAQGGHDVCGIISDDPHTRTWASKHGFTVLSFDDQLAGRLASEPFDYLFSIANSRVLPATILSLPEKGAIRFYDGPLPRYAGRYTPSWAIMQRDTRYGVTWHTMAAGVDTGDILKQRVFDLASDETALTLSSKCYEAAIVSFAELIDELADGRLVLQPQGHRTRTSDTPQRRLAGAAVLDFACEAHALAALVRALQLGPNTTPLALPKLCAERSMVAVLAAEATDTSSANPPGTVLSVGDDGFRVATPSTDLLITRLATLDGTPLTVAEAAALLETGIGRRLPILDDATIERLTTQTELAARHEAFWVDRLARLQAPAIPYADRSRARQGSRYARAKLNLPGDLSTLLSNHEGGAGAQRPADVVIAAFAAYLLRVCGQAEFNLGWSEVALRREVADARGVFATHVPICVAADEVASFMDVLASTLGEIAAVRHRFTFPRDVVARCSELAGLRSIPEGEWLPVVVETVATLEGYTPPPGCELAVAVAKDGTACAWVYDTDLYAADAITAMQRQFLTLVGNAAAEPARSLSQLSLLDEDERRQILFAWNATTTEYRHQVCIHHLFEEQAARTPDAVAVVCETAQLTYRELNERANKLARHLKAFGVGPNVLVGICVERSLDLVVAVLGVHKAGGGYVPLDPMYPRDRIAFMAADAAVPVLLTQERLREALPATDATIVCLDSDWGLIDRQPGHNLDTPVAAEHLAYVIYTSGSTGKPKGVMIEHRNVVNFFTGMDQRLLHDPPGTWLAVTSLSFDISVLELLWTLCRGFKVVIYTAGAMGASSATSSARSLSFSLFYFSSDQGTSGRDTYRLLLEGAKFADQHGFEAVWTPERHFHAFGGPFPNPSVTGAAIAALTERVKIRAGSVVLPLHSPIRVAEEWSVVDNLSNGRVGVSFASGWQPNDFVLRPENYANAKDVMVRDIEVVRRLWRGERVAFPGPDGTAVPTRILPRPVQRELPVWVTAAGNPDTFRIAGELGAGILTHLLGQSIEEVAEKIDVYRQAWRKAGHPGEGHVTLMLHTFVGDDEQTVRETVRGPMKDYLRTSMGLIEKYAYAFPIYQNRSGTTNGADVFTTLTDEERDAVLEHAFLRYYETSGLFGTPERCAAIVEQLKAIGVDEVACLIDFGVETQKVLDSLHLLNHVREQAQAVPDAADDFSIPALIRRHQVTHLQCTPSMATMLLSDPGTRAALRTLQQVLIGGEAFPAALAAQLTALVPSVLNMYGPTETTIWSSTQPVVGQPASVPVGTPIANTQMYILDARLTPVPVGVPGELFISGDGVARGYLNRPELTAERFLPNLFVAGQRMYRTGDLARWLPDGTIEFLGRIDHQVKIRGYRIELGEIESLLTRCEGIREAVVIAREDTPGDKRLVAYLRATDGARPAVADLRARLAEHLPEYMLPSAYVFLDAFPLTPNKKVDRKALPAPRAVAEVRPVVETPAVPPRSELEAQIAAIWQELLGVATVGMQDNFFDLGGNSLLIVQLHRRLAQILDRPLSLTDLFRFPTVRSLAEHLTEAEGERAAAIGTSRADARKELLARRQRMLARRS